MSELPCPENGVNPVVFFAGAADTAGAAAGVLRPLAPADAVAGADVGALKSKLSLPLAIASGGTTVVGENDGMPTDRGEVPFGSEPATAAPLVDLCACTVPSREW